MQPVRLPVSFVSTTQDLRGLLERCEQERAYRNVAAGADPAAARRDRKWAAENGWASEYDDPNLTVRCSVLERMCRALLGIEEPAPTPDPDQLDLFAEVPS